MSFTPIEKIAEIRSQVFAGFESGRSRDIAYRKKQLLQVAYMMQDNEERFQIALNADLGRPKLEATMLEIAPVLNEALIAHKKVAKWAAPESVPFDIKTFAMKGQVYKDPQGTVLIIGPFNYPLFCVFVPLIGAIAAGCAAVIKPSEVVPNVQHLIAELVPKYLDPELYQVVTAEIEGTTKLLELQWDHIMYTGNGVVGKIVATAAAKHLTPVSLELGGKSPVIVDKTADLKIVARRVLWAKNVNAGQTCIAPDYLLVTDGRQDALVAAFQEAYASFYPDGPLKSDSFSRICADRHFDRIEKQLKSTAGTIVLGGETDRELHYIAPTVVRDVTAEDSLMSAEIFGPILPILPVKDVEAAVAFVRARDHPLTLYAFSNDSRTKQYIADNTSSGMLAFNELIINGGIEGLAFGGRGPAGYGAHSDKAGFDAFTHRRPKMDSPSWIDMILGFRFPPYTVRLEESSPA
ncbi:NAD-aldehyde dehydrogenase [Clavulina sp. PMI_390]|nr:NAD-aldehyde dehydrogenase [Clavulina sp. PMI_390]